MQITFTSDILNEVAEEMGLTLGQVTYCYDLVMKRLDYLVNETDSTLINVIHLGRLSVNKFALIRQINYLKENFPHLEDKIDLLEKKVAKIDSLNDYYKKRTKGNVHLKARITRTPWFSFEKSLEEMEYLQNNDIKS